MANLLTRGLDSRILERATELSGVNAAGSGVGEVPSSSTLESASTSSTQSARTTQPSGASGAIATRNVFMLDVDNLDDANVYLG